MSVLDDMRDALAKLEAMKKTIICHPDDVEAVRESIEEQGLTGLVAVIGSPALVEPGAAYVVPTIQKFGDIPAIRDL